nr:glutamine synthetase [Perkinsela sp. CCAP 1560/4]|eukprot:KNH09607.1 glutamine synthetase [Perkinsela sp. CCAP 1560/4]
MSFSGLKDVSYGGSAVKEIRWNNKGMRGRLNLQFLPPGIEHFDVSDNSIEGPIDFPHLPPQLISLDMSNNNIKQEVVELGELPQTLELMDFTGNEIKRIVSKSTKETIDDPRIWF